VLTQSNYVDTTNWILASHIILNIANNEEEFAHNENLVSGIESMAASGHPLAVATAARLLVLVPSDARMGKEVLTNLAKYNTNSMADIIKSLTDVGLRHVPEYANHPSLVVSHGPTAGVLTTFLFSSFATVWGKALWTSSISLSPGFRTLVKDQDPKRVHSFRKQFIRNRAVGRAVFLLLMYDYLASLGMKHTSGEKLAFHRESPIQLPKSWANSKQPLSSVYPFVQTTLFICATLVMVHTQRFVVVPLLLAGGFYNIDLIKRVPFLNTTIGKQTEDVVRCLEDFDKKAKDFVSTISRDK